MADRFPLILNTNINQIQEIASGDQLDLTGNNIANAGIITATSFSGPVVAAGIITAVAADIDDFLDVGSNIQLGNAGIITATGADINGDLDVDGHTNLDNVSVGGATTMSGDLTIQSVAPNLIFTDTNHNSDFKIFVNSGVFSVRDETNGADRLQVASSGNVNIFKDLDVDGHTNLDNINITGVTTTTGVFVITAGTESTNSTTGALRVAGGVGIVKNVNVGGDLDVDGHTNLDNVSITGVSTIAHTDFSNGIDVTGDVTTTGTFSITSAAPQINLNDTNHNPDYIISNTNGVFFIRSSDGGGTDKIKINTDGHIDITGNLDCESGIDVTGNATVSGNLSVGGVLTYEDVTNVDSVGIVTAREGVFLPDLKQLKIGNTAAAPDLYLWHNSSTGNSNISNKTGDLFIQGNNGSGTVVNQIAVKSNAAVELNYQGNKKFETTSTGVTVTGTATATTLSAGGGTFSGNVSFGDNNITNVGTIALDTIKGDADDNTNINFAGSDIVNIKPAGTTRLSINTSGVVVTGDINIGSSVGRFDSSGIIKTAHGTESAPSHTFINDNDNGMYRPTTNTLGFVCGGDEKLRITSTGVIGVGVDDPAVAGGYHGMEIGGTANSGLRLSVTSNGGWAFTDYEINGTQAYIVGCKGGADSLSGASSWRICSGASFDANQLFVVNANGSVLPGSDNTQDFGSSSFRWANIYTGDLNLSNEGTVNDVDGTWGNFQIQEGENDLFLINKRNGKKYKFNLTEV